MSGNYPDGVHDGTRGAPWNQHDIATCNGCDRVYYSDTEPRGPRPDDMTTKPHTAHGHAHELCETCEDEYSACPVCGELYLEPFNGTVYDVSSARPCLDCARTEFARTGHRAVTLYRLPFAAHEKTETCATCENTTRQRFAFTDGLTVPRAKTEFVPLCRDCAARDAMTTAVILERLRPFTFEFVASCTVCHGSGIREPETETGAAIGERPCFMCAGTGREDMAQYCRRCHGSGRLWRVNRAVECDTCYGDGLTLAATCDTCGEPVPKQQCDNTCGHCGRDISRGE